VCSSDLELGCQREETFRRQDLVVVSPGVPWDLPQLQAARERKISIVPEVEAATWFLDGTVVGITGSNGKTTTTALLGKMLEASGFPTFVGGNIGVPLSAAVDRVTPDSILVTELSSFQLEAIQGFRPHIAVFLNLSPNHLDRHPSFEAYARAKQQIFRNQRAEDYAVLNADDPAVAGLAPALASRKVFFSRQQSLPSGVFVADGQVLYRVGHLERVLFERRDVALRGDFNLENVLAAAAAACLLGADFEAVRAAVKEFRGVEHRLEFVREIHGVQFYNNSKATSVDATAKSLEAFETGVHLILGGKDKGAPYAPLRPLLEKRVRDVLVIGSAAERINLELSGAVELIQAGDLATAVREAFRRSRPGDVVLLAPACSSFDQFQDYEHRGRVFKELVQRLAQGEETGKAGGTEASEARPVAFHPGAGLATPPGSLVTGSAPDTPEAPGQPVSEPSASRDGRGEPSLEAQHLGRSEPVGIYEVDMQELPAAEVEAAPVWAESLEPGSLEAVQDELLPFEVRVAAWLAPKPGEGEEGESPAPVPSEDFMNARPGGLLPDEARVKSASSRQPRLPGMD